MSTYVVTFEGAGYNLCAENGQKIGGFFISVTTDSVTPEEALQLAYEKLVTSDNYQEVAAGEQPGSKLVVSECVELSEVDEINNEISGFIFFPEITTNDSNTSH